jgi:hypothetical protein
MQFQDGFFEAGCVRSLPLPSSFVCSIDVSMTLLLGCGIYCAAEENRYSSKYSFHLTPLMEQLSFVAIVWLRLQLCFLRIPPNPTHWPCLDTCLDNLAVFIYPGCFGRSWNTIVPGRATHATSDRCESSYFWLQVQPGLRLLNFAVGVPRPRAAFC